MYDSIEPNIENINCIDHIQLSLPKEMKHIGSLYMNNRFLGSIYWDWLLVVRLDNYTVIPTVV